MTTFDTVIIFIVGISFIYSLFRGMIKELFSLLSVLTGSLVAIKFNWDLADYLKDLIENEAIARSVSFVVLFILTTVAVSGLGYGIRKLLHKSTAISGLDRVFGGLFGLLRGVVITVLFVAPLKWFPDYYERITRDSFTAPYLKQAADWTKTKLDVPDDFLDRGLRSIKKLPEKFLDAGDLNSLKENLEKKAKDLGGSSDRKEPLDEHSEEDRKKLEELIQSVTKD